jgi:hypothetical protein
MKVALAAGYRNWMFALLPTTLGIGTAVLWARSLRWPRKVDANGLTLGDRRKVPWRSIDRIGVWRDYCGGDVSRIDIHHDGGVDRVPVRSLRDGQMIASTILAHFKEMYSAQPHRAAPPRSHRPDKIRELSHSS